MAIFKRGSSSAEAVYARVLDGEHLWLAVRGEGPLVLRRDGADDLEVPTETIADAEGPLLSARLPLAAALADDHTPELELRLLSGSGRKAAPVAYAAAAPAGPGLATPPTRDRRWQFRIVSAGDDVVVRRSRLAPTVAALGFAATDEGVELRLDTDADRVALVKEGGHPVAELGLEGGTVVLDRLPSLAAGVTATFRVGDADVVRSGNALERPMSAIALPPLPEPDVTLRWTPEARLTVRREDVS